MKTLIECEKRGVKGWKCGQEGICFIGFDAKQKALASDSEKKAAEWRKSPKASTVEFLAKHAEVRAKRAAQKAKKSPKK